MGRAIDMEKDIDTLKRELSEIKSMLKEIDEANLFDAIDSYEIEE